MRRFQWVKFNGRMSAQLLYSNDVLARGNGALGVVAVEHILKDDEHKLSFDELIAKYPAPRDIIEVLPPEMPLPRILMPKVPIE